MHVLGCVWHYIAVRDAIDGKRSWIAADAELPHFRPIGSDLGAIAFTSGRAYLRAVYYAFVVVTTTGYGDIRALTLGESAFAAALVMFGGFVYYGTLAAIAPLLAHATLTRRAHDDASDELCKFLRVRRAELGDALPPRMRRYAAYRCVRFAIFFCISSRRAVIRVFLFLFHILL
jgi:hypothetical protein